MKWTIRSPHISAEIEHTAEESESVLMILSALGMLTQTGGPDTDTDAADDLCAALHTSGQAL